VQRSLLALLRHILVLATCSEYSGLSEGSHGRLSIDSYTLTRLQPCHSGHGFSSPDQYSHATITHFDPHHITIHVLYDTQLNKLLHGWLLCFYNEVILSHTLPQLSGLATFDAQISFTPFIAPSDYRAIPSETFAGRSPVHNPHGRAHSPTRWAGSLRTTGGG
jgi:hypothetical protein